MLKMVLRCPQCNRICLQLAFYEEHQKVHALQKAESEKLMVTGYGTINADCDTFVDIGTKKTDIPVPETEPQETDCDPLAVGPEEMRLEPLAVDPEEMRLEPLAVDPEEMRLEPVTVDSGEMRLEPSAVEPEEMRLDPLAIDPEEMRLAAQPEKQTAIAPVAAAAAAATAAAVPVVNDPPDVEIIDVIDYVRTCDDDDDDVVDESFSCVLCEKSFFSHPLYLTHLFSHSEKQKCVQCKENFRNAGEFEVHMIEHNLSKNQSARRFNRCKKCHASFFSQKVFAQHCSNAHGKNVLRCQLCEKEFSRMSRFQYHVLRHVGQSMYMCFEECGLVFGDKVSLRKHTSFHKASSSGSIGELTVHQCYDCAVCYFDNLSVLEHRHKAHNSQKPYYCQKCDEVYFVEKLYKSHSCFTGKV
ncbi:zinc finger protein 358-like isoform X2 [Macrobrachium rosenbergii]